MPDRVVRPGILTSDPVNSLSWGGEVFYRRLMSVADDYGRYDGRLPVLRAALYPLKLDRVSDADVGKWLTECVTAGLVSRYSADDRDYIEVLKFRQRIQGKPKWPEPHGIPPDPTVIHGESRAYTETETETKKRERAREAGDWPDRIRSAYPIQTHQGAAIMAIQSSLARGHPPESMLQAVRECAAVIRAAESKAGGPIRWVPNPQRFFESEAWREPDRLEASLQPKGHGGVPQPISRSGAMTDSTGTTWVASS